MLQMRTLLRASPNLPPSVLSARDLDDLEFARALSEVGLECGEIKELLDRDDCPRSE